MWCIDVFVHNQATFCEVKKYWPRKHVCEYYTKIINYSVSCKVNATVPKLVQTKQFQLYDLGSELHTTR